MKVRSCWVAVVTMQWSKPRAGSLRFIPSEDLPAFSRWQFGALGEPLLTQPEAPPPEDEPSVEPEAAEPVFHEADLQAAREAAYAQGYSQGQQDAQIEVERRMAEFMAGQAAQVAQRLESVVVDLSQQLAHIEIQMAEQVLQLAQAVARQVILREVTTDPEAVLPVVRAALQRLVGDGRPATVRLNPVDLDMLKEAFSAEFQGSGLSLVADSSVEAGSCLVEQSGTVVDGGLASRWRQVMNALGSTEPWRDEGGR